MRLGPQQPRRVKGRLRPWRDALGLARSLPRCRSAPASVGPSANAVGAGPTCLLLSVVGRGLLAAGLACLPSRLYGVVSCCCCCVRLRARPSSSSHQVTSHPPACSVRVRSPVAPGRPPAHTAITSATPTTVLLVV